MTETAGLDPRRAAALVRKEALQVMRDPSSLAIAFVLPLVLLFLFGYGVSLDADDVRLAVVVENPTPDTAGFTATLANSPYFQVSEVRSRQEAVPLLDRGAVRGIVVLGQRFSADLRAAEEAPVQVILDGADANTARLVQGYVQGVWSTWLTQEALRQGRTLAVPVVAEGHVRYNPQLRSRNFLIPGLIAIIMALIGTLLTALVVAREWDRGTMESLMATRVGVGEILVGKLLPYFVLGMGGMALSVGLAVTLFQVPFRGSVAALVLVSAVFLLGALAMGLVISALTRNQFAAGQVAIVAAFLPAFMLSGFVFEISAMPLPIQALTTVVSARYFVSSLQTLFLAGTVWRVLLPDLLAMAAIAAVFLAIAVRSTRKRLD